MHNTAKKHISMANLLNKSREAFDKIPDQKKRTNIELADCLMSGLAVFSLKFPSLLQFDEAKSNQRIQHNLKTLFGINKAPSDTQLRVRLDKVDPALLRPVFSKIFSLLQRQKVLEDFTYIDDHYLLSIDGTGVFSSHEVHCESCCCKNHQDGTKTYYHQLLGAVLVHPDQKEVIPLCPEPILKQDGAAKNDCERNSAKRLLEAVRKDHPHLKLIVTEDGLASNAPHIRLLKELNMHYILGVKSGDHPVLFEQLNALENKHNQKITKEKGVSRHFKWTNGIPLNASNPDVLVNVLRLTEVSKTGKETCWAWVTDMPLSQSTVERIMKGGRARWRIENETFNTLKNQGYHFEHNFGHGEKYLCTNFSRLMFLAFLIDQSLQLCCSLFNQARLKYRAKKCLWFNQHYFFTNFLFASWDILYGVLGGTIKATLVLDSG